MRLNQSQLTFVLVIAFTLIALGLFLLQAPPWAGVTLCLSLLVGLWVLWVPLPGRDVFGRFKAKPKGKKKK